MLITLLKEWFSIIKKLQVLLCAHVYVLKLIVLSFTAINLKHL